MAISTYQNESGEPLWKAYVNVRSKISPALRVQRKSLGLRSEKEAVREETRLLRECERELLEKESQGSSFGSVVDAFERWFNSPANAKLRAETTRMDYLASVRKHMILWWHRPASEITRIEIRNFFEQMKAQGTTIGHLRKVKFILNQVYEYGIENHLIRGIEFSPTVGLKLGRGEEKKPEILTLTQIRKLLTEAKNLKHKWYPIWALALLTGMRSGELYALEWNDVDFENSSVTVNKSFNCRFKWIKSTKAGYWRSVPISSELKNLLHELKAEAADRKSVLPHYRAWSRGYQALVLREFCMGIGVPSVKFHALRACFATQLIRSGIAPIQIQKICGWKDLKTMQRYIRLAGIEIEGATETLKVLPVLSVIEHAGDLMNRKPEEDCSSSLKKEE